MDEHLELGCFVRRPLIAKTEKIIRQTDDFQLMTQTHAGAWRFALKRKLSRIPYCHGKRMHPIRNKDAADGMKFTCFKKHKGSKVKARDTLKGFLKTTLSRFPLQICLRTLF